MNVLKLPVLEIFGPTFKVKSDIGQKTMTNRTAGFATTIATGAIRLYFWDGSENQLMTADEVIAELKWQTRKLRLCHPIWGESCYPSSQYGSTSHQAQGTWCHLAVETQGSSLAKLVKKTSTKLLES